MQVRKASNTGARAWSYFDRVFVSCHFIGFLFLLSGELVTSVAKRTSCRIMQPKYNETLRDGIAAGNFTKMGRVNPHSCALRCCQDRSCDLAFSVDQVCYHVSCKSIELCRTKPARNSGHQTVVAFVKREPSVEDEKQITQNQSSVREYPTMADTRRAGSGVQALDVRANSTERHSNSFHGKIGDDHARRTFALTSNQDSKGHGDYKQAKDDPVATLSTGKRAQKASRKSYKSIKPHKGYHQNITFTKASDVSTQLDEDVGGSNRLPAGFFTSSQTRDHSSDPGDASDTSLGSLGSSFHSQAQGINPGVTSESSNDVEQLGNGSCTARQVLRNVTLRSGIKSGQFRNYGVVGDMSACVEHCCAQDNCDVAFMIGPKCYAVHCFNVSLCRVKAAHSASLNPRLAYVSRTSVVNSDRHRSGLDLRVRSRAKSPVVLPKPAHPSHTAGKSSPACPSRPVLNDVMLSGGRKAGKLKLRAISGDIHNCVNICCGSPSCDAAWLLGRYCYSVECYSRDKCKPVRSGDSSIRSQLSLISRKHDQTGSEKRQQIPGFKKTIAKDLHFMLYMHLTRERFSKALKSDESLEFLNLAERIESAVAAVFVGQSWYKDATVLAFEPSPLMCQLKLALAGEAPVQEATELLVKAVQKGTLVASIDAEPIQVAVSGEGFQFDTSKGYNLVCDPEHEFDVEWKVAVFNSTDQRPCPRGSKGTVHRKCNGGPKTNATWATPDFSGCVSPKYQRFYEQSKRFADGAKKNVALKELQTKIGIAPDKVLSELEEAVYLDTYRADVEKVKKNRTLAAGQNAQGKTKSTILQKKGKKPHAIPAHKVLANPKHESVATLKSSAVHHSALPQNSGNDRSGLTAAQAKSRVSPTAAEQGNANDGGTSVWFSPPKVISSKPDSNAIMNPNPAAGTTASQNNPAAETSSLAAKKFSVSSPKVASQTPGNRQRFDPALLHPNRPMANSAYQRGLGQSRNYFTATGSDHPAPPAGLGQSQIPNRQASPPYPARGLYGSPLANRARPEAQRPFNQLAARQALQSNRAGMVPNLYGQSPLIAAANYGRIFPGPVRYAGQRYDIGKKKRSIGDGSSRGAETVSRRNKRQNTVWYSNPQTYPQSISRGNLPSAAANNIYQANAQNPYAVSANQNVAGEYGMQYPQRPAALQGPFGLDARGPQRVGAPQQGPQRQSYGNRMESPLSRSQIDSGVSIGSPATSIPLGGNPVPPLTNDNQLEEPPARLKPVQPSYVTRKQSKPLTQSTNRNANPPAKQPIIDKNSKAKAISDNSTKAQPIVDKGGKTQPTTDKKLRTEEKLAEKMKDMMSPPEPRTAVPATNSSAAPEREKRTAPMFGGDLLLAASTLRLLQKFHQDGKPATTLKQVKEFVNISSHILDLNNREEWINTAKRIASLKKKGMNILEDSNVWDWEHVKRLDEASNKSADVTPVLSLARTVQSYVMNASHELESQLREPIVTKNIMIGVQVFSPNSPDSARPISFPNYSDPKVANWSRTRDAFSFTPEIFQTAVKDKNEKVHLVNARFKTAADLAPHTTWENGAGGKPDNRTVISSAVVTCIADPTPFDSLEPRVKIVLAQKNETLSQFEQQCVWWKPADQDQEGEWSRAGCDMVASNKTHVTCACSHLTDFAVLTNTLKFKNGMLTSPPPAKSVPTHPTTSSLRMSILLAILIILLLAFIILGIVFVIWRRRKRRDDKGEQGSTRHQESGRSSSVPRSSSSQHSPTIGDDESQSSSQRSEFEEMISARKKRIAKDKERKRQSGEEKDEELLMKEKALLFSDYHQPYHFLSDSTDPSQQASGHTPQRSSRRSRPSRSQKRSRDRPREHVTDDG